MRIDIVETKLFPFAELSDEAQESALESLHDINTDDSYWHECAIDDAEACAKILGIEIKNIFFSGFSSQGDGAQFEGTYDYAKQSAQDIREYAPKDETLHKIADSLRDLQRRNFYALSASVSNRGHYYHELCTDITVFDGRQYYAAAEADEALSELLRDYMRWIYKRLESEYEFLSSAEMVQETIELNDYEFTEAGDLH